VKVKFTSSEGKALEDTLEFVAPGYTTVAATPTSVTAILTDTAWLTVDQTKGVNLELDGAAVTASAPTRTDAQVTVRHTLAQPFAPDSAHALKVIFTTGAGKQVTDPVDFTAPPP
jgi:hypothetical protein